MQHVVSGHVVGELRQQAVDRAGHILRRSVLAQRHVGGPSARRCSYDTPELAARFSSDAVYPGVSVPPSDRVFT